MKRSLLFLLVVAGFCVIFTAGPSSALTFSLNSIITGSSPEPSGSPAWLTAVFTDDPNNANQVLLQLSATGLPSQSGQFVSYWLFNVDFAGDYEVRPIYPQIDIISQNPNGVSGNNGNGDSNGIISGFDLGFYFNTNQPDRFSASAVLDFVISGVGIDADDFNQTNSQGYYTAAHVQGITGGLSGVITAGGSSQPVPEPTTMLLLSAGLIGMGFFGRKRSLK
jgi:hypothetical protein